MIRLAFAWIGLMLLLGVEVLGTLAHAGWLAWVAAPLMIGIVVLAFMHVQQESALSRIFAVTGLVWIGILLTLGTADYLARHTVPAPQRTAE